MEWLIPLQTFQVDHVQLGTLTQGPKPMTPFAYRDAEFHFPNLSFLLPHLTVKLYEPATGRLVLTAAPDALLKLVALQTTILKAVQQNCQRWFGRQGACSTSEIRAGFQPMVVDNELHLYCPNQDTTGYGIPLYAGGGGNWTRSTVTQVSGLLRQGTRVRIALKLQGLSYHIHPATGQWSGKFRLQHKILAILAA